MSECVPILDSGGHQGRPDLQEQLHHGCVIVLSRQVDWLLVQVVVPVNHRVQLYQFLTSLEEIIRY